MKNNYKKKQKMKKMRKSCNKFWLNSLQSCLKECQILCKKIKTKGQLNNRIRLLINNITWKQFKNYNKKYNTDYQYNLNSNYKINCNKTTVVRKSKIN